MSHGINLCEHRCQDVVFRSYGPFEPGPDGLFSRKDGQRRHAGGDGQALVGAQLPGEPPLDAALVPLFAQPPAAVEVEVGLASRERAGLAVAL